MSQIPNEVKTEILSKVDIVDVVGQYIKVSRKGSNYTANCPFHNEKTGSFTLSKSKQIYKCFGCGETGDAISFLMKYEKLAYPEALKRLASYCHVKLDDNYQVKKAEPKFEKHSEPLDEMFIQKKSFTKFELDLLGKEIKAETCEKDFSLYSLEYYITKRNSKGESYKISSTDDYPIYAYDYDVWGKIYQPLSADFRFSYWGQKPDNHIFADSKTSKLLAAARNGKIPNPGTKGDSESIDEDERLENIVICSGGSDALNIFSNGFNVAWLNSETADLEDYEYNRLLKPLCRNMHVLYDLDETGVRQANKIALKFLEINVVWLPEDLKKFRDRKGKPCKDAKDFFMFYRSNRHRNIDHYFKKIVSTALPLCFWQTKCDKKGEFTGYDINNEQLYGFLNAVGLYTLESKQEKRGFKYVFIQDNVVKEINEEQMQSFVNKLLTDFIKENIEYFNINLLNAVHRSNQVKLGSLEKVRKIVVDFKSYGSDHDFFFFNNSAVRISKAGGIEPVQLEKIGKHTYDFKIIDHDFRATKEPFTIEYTTEYENLTRRFAASKPQTPDYIQLKEELNGFDDLNKFTLSISEEYEHFSYLRYVYNTGRVHWKEELDKGKEALSEYKKREHDLHFINKVAAIGYMLYRYKDPSRAYMVYAMETEQSTVGKHLGGTGKTLFFTAIEKIRKMAFIDGQKKNLAENDTLFSDVKENITEFVYFDDLNKNMDLHMFMPMVTGKMSVRALYANSITLDFADSPKFGFSSNHAISNFDASLRRRSFFTAFSNYYHAEDRLRGVEERSPRTEFGKNLIVDYTEEELNKFYNFMAYCLYTYLKFRIRINPPMDSIEKRTIQRSLGDEFIYWAEDYFTHERLNRELEKTELFEAYKNTLPIKFREMAKMRNFKDKIQLYCEFKGYVFNPPELLLSETEQERNEIRKYRDNQDLYYFHIRAKLPAPHTTTQGHNIIDGDGQGGEEEIELPF